MQVNVQPVFVLDDGEHLTPVSQPPVTVTAEDWPTYSNVRFPAEMAKLQEQINAKTK